MGITSVYMGILKKIVGCFPFSPGVSAMFLVFIPTHLPPDPPGLCLAHHLVVSRCHPSVAALFGACSGGTASVGDARLDGCEKRLEMCSVECAMQCVCIYISERQFIIKRI